MKRPNNLQCIRETRKTRFGNLWRDERKIKSNLCGSVNPNTTANILLSGYGYLTVTCSDGRHSSYASGYVSPQSIQVTVNSTNPYKSIPDIHVFLSTLPVVQISNRSDVVADYSISLAVCWSRHSIKTSRCWWLWMRLPPGLGLISKITIRSSWITNSEQANPL